MPANTLLQLLDSASLLIAKGGTTEGDRLSIINGWGGAILGAVVAVILFLIAERRYGRQRREEKRERVQEREEERLRRARAAEKQVWQSEFGEIRGYQLRAEKSVDSVLAQPNISRSAADDRELEELERRFEAVSRRCPSALTPSLKEVSEAVIRLRKIKLPTDSDVQDAYQQAFARGDPGNLGSEWMASVLGAKVIEQYCAASDLRRAIDDVWKSLRMARGEE